MSGIYCIETRWDKRGQTSVEKMLKFIAHYHSSKLDHHVAENEKHFEEHLCKWASSNELEFPILYLGFHGYRRGLTIDNEQSQPRLWNHVRLEQIADFAEGFDTDWSNCIIHFATCSTVAVDRTDLAAFLDSTGFAAVSGYREEVDWIESLAFDMMYLSTLFDVTGSDYISADKMRICRDRLTNSGATQGLCDALGFQITVSET